MAMVAALVMVGSLVGCATTAESTDSSTTSVSATDGIASESVVGTVNGNPVTYGEIGDALKEAEGTVIFDYILAQTLDDFFADVEVTDTDVQLQIDLLKAQVGDDQWDMWVMYYGGGTEEALWEQVKGTIKQEQRILSLAENLDMSDEVLQEYYSVMPNSFDIMVTDAVFVGDETSFVEAQAMVDSGSSLQEIADAFELSISTDEHTYFETDGIVWNKSISTVSVGDMIYTTLDSGVYAVAEVTQLHTGIDNEMVREDIELSYKYEKGYELLEAEYIEFLKEQDVTILGDSVALYNETAY